MASSSEPEGRTSTPDPARDFLEFWKNYFEQTAIQTRILLESMQGGKTAEQMHNQWLGSLSDSLDAFMRTPAFLDVLKQTLKRMVDLKVLQDQMAQPSAHPSGGSPHAEDPGISERVRHAEQTILTRLALLDERLRVIEERLPEQPEKR